MLFSMFGFAGLAGLVTSRLNVRPVFLEIAAVILVLGFVFSFARTYTTLVAYFVVLGTVLGLAYVIIVSMTPL